MSDESQQLDEVIDRFVKSEESLRRITQAVEGLDAAKRELSVAREDLAVSDARGRQSLEELRKHLAAAAQSTDANLSDAASAIYGLTTEMRGIARDLKDTAIAFRTFGPDRLDASFLELANRIKGRERMLVLWMSLLTVGIFALGALAIVM